MTKPPCSRGLTRRDSLLLGASALGFAALGKAEQSDMPESDIPGEAPTRGYAKDSEAGAWRQFDAIHAGKGSVNIKRFPFGGDSAPANFIIYEIPPGASEGVHVHHLDDRNKLGAFDEYYYVISGQGQMQINGTLVAVAAGDHVHTPLDVPHGIENTDPHEHLKVFLTFIDRAIKS